MTGTCPHGWTYAHNCPTQPAPEQDQARKQGGCGIVVNVDAWCDGDAVPSTAGLCDSPETHREHATPDLSDYERATVERIEGAPAAEESLRERVARAICAARSQVPWAVQAGWQQHHYGRMADAAIAVMRGEL